ncbi:MAG: CAP domain-containing protein [Deltaproteobacteria bacterium]|jgi:uncharacterized protein YkwD|nr:CAP domain-containing protein [Deltaproteobacteria bacterium]
MRIKDTIVVLASVLFLGLVYFSHAARERQTRENAGPPKVYYVLGSDSEKAYAGELFELINEFRKENRLPALVEDRALMEAASERANEMAGQGKATLERPDGSDWTTLLPSEARETVVGENHSVGNLDPAALMENFAANPDDAADFAYANYKKIGIGVKEDKSGNKHAVLFFATDPVDAPAFAAKLFGLVNEERKLAGVPPLVYDENAARAANVRANEVARLPGHQRPGGAKWSTVLAQMGIEVKIAGENLARGQKDPETVMKDWMASPGHRENILRPEFAGIGVAVAPTPDASLAWVQLFVAR